MANLPQTTSKGSAKTYDGFGIPLILPAWIIIGFFLVIPVAMMLVYSFLTKELKLYQKQPLLKELLQKE